MDPCLRRGLRRGGGKCPIWFRRSRARRVRRIVTLDRLNGSKEAAHGRMAGSAIRPEGQPTSSNVVANGKKESRYWISMSDLTLAAGGMYALVCTLWAICLPGIREDGRGRISFGWAYWSVIAIFYLSLAAEDMREPAEIEDLSLQLYLLLTALLAAFAVFALTLYHVLWNLSWKR